MIDVKERDVRLFLLQNEEHRVELEEFLFKTFLKFFEV